MRWLRRIALALAVLLVLSALAGWYGLHRLRGRGLPQREGSARLSGLAAAVSVRFDARAVPYVVAASPADAAAALGWLHANERMTQMELGRRAAAGRLAEIAGAAAVALDAHTRQLGLSEMAEAWWSAASPETHRDLEAYASGVNAWLEARREDLPPGLTLLSVEPEPWRPQDSLAFGALLARDLSFLAPELERFDVLRRLGPEALRDLYGLDATAPLDPAALALAQRLGPPPEDEDLDALTGEGPGSNNWLVAGTRSATGTPLVANDPHLGLGLPSVWYQASVRAPGYQAAGMTLVGLPYVIIGQGPGVAWAVTNTGRDQYDFLWEDEDQDGVLRGEQRVAIERRREKIAVRFDQPVRVTIERTDVGPLVRHGGEAFSLRWSARDAFDIAAAFRGLAQARDLDQARAAIAGYLAPSQNLLLADAGGHVARTVLGRSPDRPPQAGFLPLPASAAAARWSDHRPQSEMPWELDPPDGVLSTSNDDVDRDRRPNGGLWGEFDTPYRAQRSRELLLERRDWSAEDLAALQEDRTSLFARALIELARPHAKELSERDARAAWSLLSGWDGEMAIDSPAAALWIAFRRHLYDAFFADELEQAHLGEVGFGYDRRRRLIAVLSGRMQLDWADDVGTSDRVETAAERLELALAEAWRQTAARLGADAGRWRYGDARSLTLHHPLSPLPWIGRSFTRGPYPVGGSATTLLAMAGAQGPDGREQVTFGPSMRWVSDLADPDHSRACLPGGQSGHPYDPHYDDQIADFLAGRTHGVHWSEEAAEAAAVSQLVLRP